jgi:sugar O-acyltransferase (sialic acid O-acetyltransferase NeuD family)
MALRQIEESVDEIIVVGGGGHAKVVISILKKLSRYNILGYTDITNRGVLLGISYLGSDDELARASTSKKINLALAVGQVGIGNMRNDIWTRLNSLSVLFPSIVSPNAIVNEDASCGEGAVVMDGAVINTGAIIGRGAIVNTNSTVEHDVRIEDWVHVAPGATICGDVTVGRFSMIGAGATVKEGIKISSGCVVGAGAAVVNDLKEPGIYVGCPARRIH